MFKIFLLKSWNSERGKQTFGRCLRFTVLFSMSRLIHVMCYCWRHISMLNIPHYEPQKQNSKIIILDVFILRAHMYLLLNWVMKNRNFISWKRLNFIYIQIVSVGFRFIKLLLYLAFFMPWIIYVSLSAINNAVVEN